MRRGDWRAAWAIADAVLAARDPATRDDPARPYHERWVWDGRDLRGRAVVVRCYHGLGDTLQFARFLPALRQRARHVTLEVQPELYPLLRAIPGADRVVPFDTARPMPACADIEIMELQYALRAQPVLTPVLTVEPRPVAGASVGVCWRAGGWDADRSIPLAQLRPVLPPGAVSLQRGETGLFDPLAGTMDLLATAGFVASLRAVITVDSMIAHLAGTLGRPVHLMLKAVPDWRWGKAAATPWYPTMQLHRQRAPGDWTHALESLAESLKAAS